MLVPIRSSEWTQTYLAFYSLHLDTCLDKGCDRITVSSFHAVFNPVVTLVLLFHDM